MVSMLLQGLLLAAVADSASAAVAVEIAKLKQKPVVVVKPLTYAEGYYQALREQKPLFVWIAQAQQPGEWGDVIHCEVKTHDGITVPSLMLGKPRGEDMLKVSTFTGVPSRREARRALGKDATLPFESSPRSARDINVRSAVATSTPSPFTMETAATRTFARTAAMRGGTSCSS